MRTTWKRTAAGLLLAGAVGGAALGLARPTDPPTVIPHADDPDTPAPPAEVIPVAAAAPALRNDPAVALEWGGPEVVPAHRPTDYTLTVRNTCGQALQKVVLQVRAPKGVEIVGVRPAVKPIDGVYLWEFGTLDARAAKSVTVTLNQATRGEMTCQAWVTLTGTSAMKATVKEPKLAVTIHAPETVVAGDKYRVRYAVSNPGDHPAADVQVRLPQAGRTVMPGVELKPGEAFDTAEEFTATAGGPVTHTATATGADGLKASAQATVRVLVPKLDVRVSGPGERLIGKRGRYTVTVSNPGDVPLGNVVAGSPIPAGFEVCDPGAATLSADRLTWPVGDLVPGGSKTFAFEGRALAAGAVTHKVEAAGDRRTSAAAECVTKVEGIPGLRMELVDSVDPVEKGGEIVYEIRVTNTGTKADSNVQIVCELPRELMLEFVSCSGPTKGEYIVEKLPPVGANTNAIVIKSNPTIIRRSVTFDPISDLAPKTEAVFKVKVKGIGSGDVRFKAVMTSKHLTAPVTKEESTRVYGE